MSGAEVVFQIQQTVGVEVISRIVMVCKAGEWKSRRKKVWVMAISGSVRLCSVRS
ncbi:hypothetical protein D3C71_873860 [compost metagenome]